MKKVQLTKIQAGYAVKILREYLAEFEGATSGFDPDPLYAVYLAMCGLEGYGIEII